MEHELINNVYRIKDYEEVLANCAKFISETLKRAPDNIITAEDRKAVKSARADINSQIKVLKDFRLELNKQVLGTINEQIKDMEKMLSEAERKLKVIVDEDKAKQDALREKAPEPLCMRIYYLDESIGSQIKTWAERKFGSAIDIL